MKGKYKFSEKHIKYMHLKKYLKTKKMTYSKMAQRLDLSISTIHNLCTGKRIPSKQSMKKIHSATKGRVRPKDFYDL